MNSTIVKYELPGKKSLTPVTGRSLRYNVIRFVGTFYPSVFMVSGEYTGCQPDIIIPLTVKRYNGLAIELMDESNVSSRKDTHKYLRKIGWKVILSNSYQTITKKITNYMNQVSNSCQLCRKYYSYQECLQKHMLSLNHYENIFMADYRLSLLFLPLSVVFTPAMYVPF